MELIKEEEFTIQQPSIGTVGDDAPENNNQQVELEEEEEQEKKNLESIKLPCYYCEKEISKKHMWRHIEEVHNKTKVNTKFASVSAYPHKPMTNVISVAKENTM